MITFAIGTTRAPKVEGIQSGVAECPYFKNTDVDYILQSVSSDISDMPKSLEETMQWAKNRAKNLKKAGIIANYYIGIEGGINDLGERKFLGGIVYIENAEGEWRFGFSPFMEIPKAVEKRIFEIRKIINKVLEEK